MRPKTKFAPQAIKVVEVYITYSQTKEKLIAQWMESAVQPFAEMFAQTAQMQRQIKGQDNPQIFPTYLKE